MALDLFAEMYVRDFTTAVDWYEKLFGSPPTFQAHDTEVVWELAEHRSVAVEERPDKAGHCAVTVFVDDFDDPDRCVHPHRPTPTGHGRRHLAQLDHRRHQQTITHRLRPQLIFTESTI